MPQVSIIVPFHNAELFLERCLRSIQQQTYQNWEAVLVGDGSTDGSVAICQRFCETDRRFRYYAQQKATVGAARRLAMEKVQGAYVIHCDSDDYMAPTALEEEMNAIEQAQADVLVFDYIHLERGEETLCSQRLDTMDAYHVLHGILQGKIVGSTWNKLVRTDFIRQHDILFSPDLHLCEDIHFLTQLLQQNPRLVYLPRPLYVYDNDVNANSITRAYTKPLYMHNVKYAEELRSVVFVEEFIRDAEQIQMSVKFEGFAHGFLSDKELRHLYPALRHRLMGTPTTFINRVLLWMACHHLGWVAHPLFRLKSRVKRQS